MLDHLSRGLLLGHTLVLLHFGYRSSRDFFAVFLRAEDHGRERLCVCSSEPPYALARVPLWYSCKQALFFASGHTLEGLTFTLFNLWHHSGGLVWSN